MELVPQVVQSTVSGGVARIVIANPPVNAIDAHVRAGLLAAFDLAEADPTAKVILLRAAGRTWPVGADLHELGAALTPPFLRDVCARIAASAKPVVAELHGSVLGGGLELALACEARVADKNTVLGFPEVGFGLLPSAGGTQRLPRLTGAGPALDLMLQGTPISAARALEIGLIDKVAQVALEAEALARAGTLMAQSAGLIRLTGGRGLREPGDYLEAVATARAALDDNALPAARRIVDCVEAALLLPHGEGMAVEQAAFEDLLATPEAAALRHAFLAERRAAHFPELGSTTQPREIVHVGVVGGGPMGAGICGALLGAGCRVSLLEIDGQTLAVGLRRIAQDLEREVANGVLSAQAREEEWDRIAGTTEASVLAGCQLVIEATEAEDAAKAQRLRDIDAVIGPRAILATTTSAPDLAGLAKSTLRPGRVLGLHFPGPVDAFRLIEVVVPETTAADVVASGVALVRRLGKVPVRVRPCDGFITGRMQAAYDMAADFLLEAGASPYQIDAAMRVAGFALGPFQALDRAGLDLARARRKRQAKSYGPEQRHVGIGDHLRVAGWLGRKAGRGYYRYPEGAPEGVEDPDVLALVDEERRARGLAPRQVQPSEIRRRCLAAMANEGVRLLSEGIALRPSDIDVVAMLGMGFPRHAGGPMQAADQRGLLAVRDMLRDFARRDAWFWQPGPLWNDLIKNGRRFADLNLG